MIKPTAEQLYIHTNTLKYKLNQITSIFFIREYNYTSIYSLLSRDFKDRSVFEFGKSKKIKREEKRLGLPYSSLLIHVSPII
ncbi:helix-turn-helix domain-containing protein [Peribacillus frigoritolerans]|uniref:helix-turn-helix domain-containing protein n=1 Tax=Peribacillus frigoritolerans TaxID=450367 RepID=UPI00359F8FE1